jgi:hypothetical protein
MIGTCWGSPLAGLVRDRGCLPRPRALKQWERQPGQPGRRDDRPAREARHGTRPWAGDRGVPR